MPKKHLKVRAVLQTGNAEYFDMHIIEQTHLTHLFGDAAFSKLGRGKVFVHEGVALVSNYMPIYVIEDYVINDWKLTPEVDVMVQLKGSSTYNNQDVIRNVPTKHWPRIKKAVEAYNEYFN